jgi:hypothetical protein
MTWLPLGSCRDNQVRWPGPEPTIAEILSDPIVKELMTADGVDERVLRDQLTIVARRLDNLTAALPAFSPAPSPRARGARSGSSRASARPAAHMD